MNPNRGRKHKFPNGQFSWPETTNGQPEMFFTPSVRNPLCRWWPFRCHNDVKWYVFQFSENLHNAKTCLHVALQENSILQSLESKHSYTARLYYKSRILRCWWILPLGRIAGHFTISGINPFLNVVAWVGTFTHACHQQAVRCMCAILLKKDGKSA